MVSQFNIATHGLEEKRNQRLQSPPYLNLTLVKLALERWLQSLATHLNTPDLGGGEMAQLVKALGWGPW